MVCRHAPLLDKPTPVQKTPILPQWGGYTSGPPDRDQHRGNDEKLPPNVGSQAARNGVLPTNRRAKLPVPTSIGIRARLGWAGVTNFGLVGFAAWNHQSDTDGFGAEVANSAVAGFACCKICNVGVRRDQMLEICWGHVFRLSFHRRIAIGVVARSVPNVSSPIKVMP